MQKLLAQIMKFGVVGVVATVIDFGIMNLLEVEQVNQDKWNEYIARNTECKTWHEFGKLAMIDWMKHKLEEAKQAKN